MPNVDQIEKGGDISGLVNAAVQLRNTIGMVFSEQKTLAESAEDIETQADA
jgi:hypothetical protein